MAWRVFLAAATALAVSAACASEQTPQLGAEKSFDGLVRVESARSTAAWIDPNLDLSGYTKLKLRGQLKVPSAH